MNKAIHIDDLIAEIGQTLDFRRVHHLEAPEDQKELEEIYKTLVQIAPTVIELQRVREQLKPPGGSGQ